MHTIAFLSIGKMCMHDFHVSCDAEGGVSSHRAAVWEGKLLNHRATDPCSAPAARGSVLMHGHALHAFWQTCIPVRTQVQRSMFTYVWNTGNRILLRLCLQNYFQPNTHTLEQWVRGLVMCFICSLRRIWSGDHMFHSEKCIEWWRIERKRKWGIVTDGRREVERDAWRHVMGLSYTLWDDEEEEEGQKMDGCLEWKRGGKRGGGTEGEKDKWSEGGIVVGYTADETFRKKGRRGGDRTANNSSLSAEFNMSALLFSSLKCKPAWPLSFHFSHMSEGSVCNCIHLTALVSVCFID